MYIAGGVCLALVPLFNYVVSKVIRMVTVKRAMSTLLQVVTLLMLPLGLVIIAAGVYTVETAAFASAPVTALIMFGLGVLVVFLSLMGCFGTAVEGRRMLSFFSYLVSFLGTVFLSLGVITFIQADVVQTWVLDNWDMIRQALPPTFTGRYDKGYFQAFLKANLKALGFLNLVLAVYLMLANFLAFSLSNVLALGAATRDADLKQMRRRASSETPRVQRAMKKEWEQRWRKGNRKQRCLMKTSCCICSCLLFAVTAVGVVFLLFQSFCTALNSTTALSVFDGLPASIRDIHVHNAYDKGVVKLTRDPAAPAAVSFELKSTALKASLATSNSTLTTTASNMTLVALPNPGSWDLYGVVDLAAYDLACQTGEVQVVLPVDTTTMQLSLTSASTSGFDLSLVPEDKVPLQQVNAASALGSTIGKNLRIGSATGPGALHITSTSGDVILDRLVANCGPAYAGSTAGEVAIATSLGFVNLTDAVLTNCALNITGGAAPVFLNNFAGSSISGGVKRNAQRVTIDTTGGRIVLQQFAGDGVTLTSRSGTVSGSAIDARFLRVGTTSGTVSMDRVFPSPGDLNNLQVETMSGPVTLGIAPDGFKGEFTLSSSSGTVRITRGGQPLPPCPICVTRCTLDASLYTCMPDGSQCTLFCASSSAGNGTATAGAVTGRIGCFDSDCGYYGEMLVTTGSGNIAVDILVA